jgi:hypothetical protein
MLVARRVPPPWWRRARSGMSVPKLTVTHQGLAPGKNSLSALFCSCRASKKNGDLWRASGRPLLVRQGRGMNIASFNADSADIGDELEGAQPCRMVVDIGNHDKFVGASFRGERLDA